MFQQGWTLAALQAIFNGGIDTATLKMALYDPTASLTRSTAVYTTTGEVVGVGYDAGGVDLTNVVVNINATYGVYLSFDQPQWSNALFTAAGALIYNASLAVAVLDFGGARLASGQFVPILPASTPLTALLRFNYQNVV